MKLRKTMLSASIVAALGFAGNAFAQQATAPAQAPAASSQDATDLDAVIVTGIRASQEKSLDTKRNAATHIEAVTAEDVGTRPSDMASVFATTRFVSCVPAEVGGSGNPSPWTAKGVVCAMQAALEVAGLGTLAGKSVAMQGLGNVGAAMVAELLKAGVAHIAAADISASNVEAVRQRFQDSRLALRLAERGDDSILFQLGHIG